jgi:peptidoglycan/LPS O-acetylase OafA/YrhL
MPDPASKQSTYLPTLDGWRAVSIILVILHHSQIQSHVPVFGALLQWMSDAGEVGVELFFAISGLLICSRLLEEEAQFGQICLKSFYLRRCFRILPAAIFYLLVIAILAAFHIIPLLPLDWFGSLFFFRNYAMVLESMHHSPLALHWYTGHFWSLSMEEHFYLVLPGVLVIFRKTRRWVLSGFVIAVALRRFFVAHIMHNDSLINFRTDTHVDALFIPALMALLLYPLLRSQIARRWIPAWFFPIFLTLEIILLFNRVPFVSTLQATVIPLLILSTVLHPGSIPGRVLEMKPVCWIGWISYSLYLWQQLFFGSRFVNSPPQLATLREWPVSFVALLACAAFSYYLVEKPLIRLGHRLARAATNNHGAKRPPFHQRAAEIATSSSASPTP